MTEETKFMQWYFYVIIAYIVIANITAVAMTVHDKRAAQKKHRRVPERTLLITAALSGCILMYITMHIVHHKTKKPKFMVGIPVIFIAEVIASIGICTVCGVFSA